MSNKRLMFRYGQSAGVDKVAENELRRRGLTDTQIRGVIYGYRQGEYNPRGGSRPGPDMGYEEKQVPPDSATQPKAAVAKDPIMRYGKFKGLLFAKVPGWHLAWCYASFSQGRKRIEKELRSRGCDDEELEYFKEKYPYRGKSPKKQGPKK
jgi:hypothetical protein